MIWAEVPPDIAMVSALAHADAETPRSEIEAEALRIASSGLSKADRKRAREPLRDLRKRWSERLAGGCAVMIAGQLRGHKVVSKRFRVAPLADGSGQETFWPLGYRSGKRIDVVVAGELSGLQLGASLKGLNFRDDESGNFDKNLTGRLYELADEMATVHRHLPRAFMTGMFFMPVGACFDKGSGQSSFAHAVLDLRRRSGRDHADPSQISRADYGVVALYAPGDQTDTEKGIAPGVVRFFPVDQAPPRSGLPPVEQTLDLEQVADRIVAGTVAETAASDVYGPAEDDTASSAEQLTPLDDVVSAEQADVVDQLTLDE